MAIEKQRKTFLSYSRVNTDFAKKLARELKTEGFDIWLDQLDIPPGARWDVELEKALEESEIFMIIMTPDSIASENVRDEIGYAIDTGKRFLPIMLETCNVPLRLRRFQYVDFSTKSFEDGVESAKRLLRGLIAEDTIPRGKLSDDAKEKIAQAEADRKAKKGAERIAKRSADEALASKVDADGSAKQKAGAELDPKVKKEADGKSRRESESDRVKESRENVIKASDLLAQGRKLLENKDLEKAADKFRQVLTLTPNHAETMKLLADAEAQIVQKKKEAEGKAKEEAERLARQKAEAEKAAKAEADRKAKEEAERLARQKAEAEKVAKAEADRKAKEEAEKAAKAEADRKAKEEADRIAKAETDRKAKEEAERKAKEEARRKTIEKSGSVPSTSTSQKKPMSKGLLYGIVGAIAVVVIGTCVGVISTLSSGTPEAQTPVSSADPIEQASATKSTEIEPTNTSKPAPTKTPTKLPIATSTKTSTRIPTNTSTPAVDIIGVYDVYANCGDYFTTGSAEISKGAGEIYNIVFNYTDFSDSGTGEWDGEKFKVWYPGREALQTFIVVPGDLFILRGTYLSGSSGCLWSDDLVKRD